jgi:hypothetical protein
VDCESGAISQVTFPLLVDIIKNRRKEIIIREFMLFTYHEISTALECDSGKEKQME